MAGKESLIPLREILIRNLELKDKYVKIMRLDNIAVVCLNNDARKKRILPFKALYDNNNTFWLQSSVWEFFIYEEDLSKVNEKAVGKPFDYDLELAKALKENAERPVQMGFGAEYEEISGMSTAEQVRLINEDNLRLNTLITHKSRDTDLITGTLVNTTNDAAMVNHAILVNAMNLADDDAKKLTQDLVDSTCDMVKSSVSLVSGGLLDDKLMNTLVSKSNGTIVQHMTRVYLNGLAFLAYYNKLVSKSSAIDKLRISFPTKYRSFYADLLPNVSLDDLTLEKVFRSGMRAIPQHFFCSWAVGFLIHDIGKANAVEYHEGEAAYDRGIVVEHVKLGYNWVINKTNYPREAGLITGYHHEYYGNNAGYGYFRAYLEQYKKSNPGAKQNYCIAYELESILDYHTKAYFPAKVLEIIDVYDSVTDPNRIYHKTMDPEQALAMIREEFIEKQPKLDIILFDIFESYIREKQHYGK